jgi:cell wall-associated NlpC family hydrolase
MLALLDAQASAARRMEPAWKWVKPHARKHRPKRALRFALAHRVVRLALHFRGVPYVWGGTSPRGFDCSGLVQYVYRRVHRWLPRTTWGQMAVGHRVSWAGLRAGDVLFFYGGEHEALYIGHGMVVHAPHTGAVVRLASVSSFSGYAGARRYW